MDDPIEQSVIRYVIDFPAHGQHRTSNELRNKACLYQVVGYIQYG